MLRTLISHIGRYKVATILAPVFTACEVIMEVAIPFVIAYLIDEGISAGNMGNVLMYGGIMLVLAFASLAFGVLAGVFAAYASSGFARNLRDAEFEAVQTFSFSNIDRFSTAGLITRMTTDVTNIQNAFQMLVRLAIRAPFMMIASMTMAFVVSPDLSMVFLVALVVIGALIFTLMSRIVPVFREVFQKYDELNADTQENISGIRVVKSYVREEYENSRFIKAATNLYRLFVKAEGRLAFNQPIMMLGIFSSMIAISWLGAQFITFGSLTTGELTSMFSYLMSTLMSLMMLSMVFVMITMSIASARRISEVLNEKPDITNPANPVMEIPNGSIEFENVSFSYYKKDEQRRDVADLERAGGEAVLEGITLSISPGETIGIVGGTGSGKSSLVSLISRLYDVDSGSVKVGGVDVREYDLELLRDGVSVVLQNNVLFSGTILENLRWGNEDATEEECVEACEIACADNFVRSFPNGYNTYVEQGGSNLSGGQKQRLCIARALLKKPKILVLDDSTSAVDTATEASIRKGFATRIPNTTKLIISQRISSVQDADRILVLDNGRISGIGTHEELLANNTIYQEIYEMQMKSGGDFDEPESDHIPDAGFTEGGDAR